MGLLLDDKGVIYIPKPVPREVGGRPESFSLKCSMYRFATMGLTRDPIATPLTPLGLK